MNCGGSRGLLDTGNTYIYLECTTQRGALPFTKRPELDRGLVNSADSEAASHAARIMLHRSHSDAYLIGYEHRQQVKR